MRTLDDYREDIATRLEEYDSDADNFIADEDMSAKFVGSFNAVLNTITQLKRAVTRYTISQDVAEPVSDSYVSHPKTEYTLPSDFYQLKSITVSESNLFYGELYEIVNNKLYLNSYFKGTIEIRYYRKIDRITSETVGTTEINIPIECEEILVLRTCALVDQSGDNYGQFMADYETAVNSLDKPKGISVVRLYNGL